MKDLRLRAKGSEPVITLLRAIVGTVTWAGHDNSTVRIDDPAYRLQGLLYVPRTLHFQRSRPWAGNQHLRHQVEIS